MCPTSLDSGPTSNSAAEFGIIITVSEVPRYLAPVVYATEMLRANCIYFLGHGISLTGQLSCFVCGANDTGYRESLLTASGLIRRRRTWLLLLLSSPRLWLI